MDNSLPWGGCSQDSPPSKSLRRWESVQQIEKPHKCCISFQRIAIDFAGKDHFFHQPSRRLVIQWEMWETIRFFNRESLKATFFLVCERETVVFRRPPGF
ncbi:hypothetical protein CWI35_00530 [[Bacillus] caldolyticus]|uniref:Uncharacterized protein n=1 Tax=Bacillus caldolyticus TaxID=1394 RepID=A0ABM6QIK9_BACCL|nr:hypothetical protein CWI35_00530 [[Bacillus] caldolyticus]